MALDAGSVYAVLGGRFMPGGFAQFDAAMKKSAASAAAAEKGITGSSTRSSAALTAMGTAARTGAAAGLLAVGLAAGSSVKYARDFDKEMRNVNSIAQLNEKQFKNLSTSVLKLSGKTAQAPVTLAKGVYQLVSSGFSAKQSLSILESSAKAASAGLTTTEVATTAVAAVLNAYKRPASDAAQVSDDLFQTVNLGVVSFEQLASSIGDALPFAQSLGVGLKDVGAATATMTKAGLSAPETMTRIKGAMTAMLKPSEDMKGAFQKLGVASGGELIKKTGSFQGALQALAGTVGNNKEAMAKLFPDIRGLGAALLLTGKNAKAANADLAGFADTTGVTDRVLAEQKKSLDFQMRQLGANFQALGVTIGSELIPPLTDASQMMNEVFNPSVASTFGDVLGTTIDVLTVSFSMFLSALSAVEYSLAGLFKIGATFGIPGMDKAFKDTQKTAKATEKLAGDLVDKVFSPKMNVTDAVGQLMKLDAVKLSPKVQKVLLNGDTTAEQKIKQLQRMGIPAKVARFLVSGDSTAKEKIMMLRALGIPTKVAKLIAKDLTKPGVDSAKQSINSLPAAKDINLAVTTTKTIIEKVVKRASGRSNASGAETAMVGEGGGPEYVVNSRTGQVAKVSSATLMQLGREDYVIPTEPKYRGRARDLLTMLAADLGIASYAGGKKAAKKREAQRRKDDRRIGLADTNATRFGTEMDTAQQQGKQKAWETARDNRLKQLKKEEARILASRKRTKKGGTRYAELSNQLASVRNAMVSTGNEKFEPPQGPEVTTYNAFEQALIDQYDAELAMAELTTGKQDDAAALKKKVDLLQGVLDANPTGAGRGGYAAVKTIAGDLKSAKDALTEATKPPELTADQQSVVDQQMNKDRITAQNLAIDRLVNATVGSAGNTLVFQSYVPPSPSEAKRLADYTVGGLNYQGGTPASTTNVGV